MKLVGKNLMCTSIPEPREWKMDDGRSGVTYKVELSDGQNSVQINCASMDSYGKFRPFEKFNVEFDLQQTLYDGRRGVKAIVTGCEMVNK